MCEDASALLSRVRNAGSVFVGCSSVVGDYAAGATHVLPTGGLARSTGGLGIEAFLKPLQVVTRDRGRCASRGRGGRSAGADRGACRCTRRRWRDERRAGEGPAGRGRVRAVRLGRGGLRGRGAPRRPARDRSQVRPEHAAAAGRAAGAARREHGAAQRVPGRHVPRAARGRSIRMSVSRRRTSSSARAQTT